MNYLTPIQLDQLITTCVEWSSEDETLGRKSGVLAWMIIHLGCAAGLRPSEMANLRVGDCCFEENRLIIRKGKGGKREEVCIGLSLKSHLYDFINLKKQWGENVDNDDYLLISKHGNHFTHNRSIQQKFKKAISMAELPSDFSIDSLRQTYAINIYRISKDLFLLKRQMRVSSIAAAAYYVEMANEIDESCLDML
jgi:site-specific recombinase XerC